MKKLSLLSLLALCLLFTSCGSKGEITYTGKSEGYGGTVSASVTVRDGKIISSTVTGADETEAVGGTALEQINQNILPAYKGKEIASADFAQIDTIAQATVTCDAAIAALEQAQADAKK